MKWKVHFIVLSPPSAVCRTDRTYVFGNECPRNEKLRRKMHNFSVLFFPKEHHQRVAFTELLAVEKNSAKGPSEEKKLTPDRVDIFWHPIDAFRGNHFCGLDPPISCCAFMECRFYRQAKCLFIDVIILDTKTNFPEGYLEKQA